MEDEDDDEEEMTDEEWEEESEAIMNEMYPEGYDPDVDGCIFDNVEYNDDD